METETLPNKAEIVTSTINNIIAGIRNQIPHDIWVVDDVTAYCLCRMDIDADGLPVYTAYQLWIDPKHRDGRLVRELVKHLREFAKLSMFYRLYVISSRTDKIKAYARGLGQEFKVQSVIFVDDFKENNLKRKSNAESN